MTPEEVQSLIGPPKPSRFTPEEQRENYTRLRDRTPNHWDVSQPSRGLGDTIAKIMHATGIAQTVHAVAKTLGWDCGCAKRQEKLNEAVPYGK